MVFFQCALALGFTQARPIRRTGLPEEIKIRFVTVRLKTGGLEVLATNLLDEDACPTQEFGELYHQRWAWKPIAD